MFSIICNTLSLSTFSHSFAFHSGVTMWKVKNTSMSNSSIIFDSQPIKLDSDPGRSLRNFKFDTASILQAMESAFAA